jgi:fructokinase
LGEKGSIVYYKDLCVKKESFLQEKTIDTTGAGDIFFASVINYILEHGMEKLTEGDLHEMLLFANAAASMITTVRGALRVVPDRCEVENFIKKYRY